MAITLIRHIYRTGIIESLKIELFVPVGVSFFTPGLRPNMFPKALASGTDIICVELEDGMVAAKQTKALGFSGKGVIHPIQISR